MEPQEAELLLLLFLSFLSLGRLPTGILLSVCEVLLGGVGYIWAATHCCCWSAFKPVILIYIHLLLLTCSYQRIAAVFFLLFFLIPNKELETPAPPAGQGRTLRKLLFSKTFFFPPWYWILQMPATLNLKNVFFCVLFECPAPKWCLSRKEILSLSQI